MKHKEQFIDDLDYVYEEAGDIVLYKTTTGNKEIPVIVLSDIDVESFELHVISARTSDVEELERGENFTINGGEFECLNFEHQIDGLETIINLKKL